MKLLIKKSFLRGEKVEDIVTKDIVSAKRKTVDSKKRLLVHVSFSLFTLFGTVYVEASQQLILNHFFFLDQLNDSSTAVVSAT